MRFPRIRTVVACAAVFALCGVPILGQSVADDAGRSTIVGKVVDETGKIPVQGATILAYHLSSEQVFTSSPSGADGSYVIDGLPYGYFDVAVETEAGLFVGNQVINLPPSGKIAVNFTTTTYPSGAGEGREFPGSDSPTSGVAQIREKLKGREFWRSPKGVAIISGAGGVALLAIASGSSSDSASPSTP